jgi:large subunit ribosomal protein L37e
MKGTPSMGKKSGKKTHITCRRCGNHAYHIRKKRCSKCGYGKSARQRNYNWQKK